MITLIVSVSASPCPINRACYLYLTRRAYLFFPTLSTKIGQQWICAIYGSQHIGTNQGGKMVCNSSRMLVQPQPKICLLMNSVRQNTIRTNTLAQVSQQPPPYPWSICDWSQGSCYGCNFDGSSPCALVLSCLQLGQLPPSISINQTLDHAFHHLLYGPTAQLVTSPVP